MGLLSSAIQLPLHPTKGSAKLSLFQTRQPESHNTSLRQSEETFRIDAVVVIAESGKAQDAEGV